MVNKIEKQVIPDSPKILLKQAIAVHVNEEKFGTKVTVNGEEQATWNADEKADVDSVREETNMLLNEVEGVREETNMLRDEVLSIYGNLSHASTRIENVEQDAKLVKEVLFNKGIIAVAEVEQAYTSRVTANGENIVDGQKTPVTLINGSTVRCENLLIFPYANASVGTYTNNGITFTVNADGTVLVNGTATNRARLILKQINQGNYSFKSGIYTLSGVPFSKFNGTNGELQFAFAFADGTTTAIYGSWNGKTFELTQEAISYYLEINVIGGQTANNWLFKPMFNAGSTALPYQPYFTDLKHAKIDSIVSTGRNLWNSNDSGIAKTGFAGLKEIEKNDWAIMWAIPVPKNTPITFSIKKLGTGSKMVYVAFANDIKIGTPVQIDNNLTGYYDNWDKRTTNSGDNKYLLLCTEPVNLPKDMMINIGDTALPYTPFIQETYQLPETLELGEWDSFNPQTSEIVRGTKRLVLTGEENWRASDTDNSYSGGSLYRNTISIYNALSVDNAADIQAISNLYNGGSANNTWYLKTCVAASGDRLDIYDPEFATNDISLWKQHLRDLYAAGTPLIVEYKLATPTVETLENAPKSYTAYNQGNETAVLENEEYGAIPTITNEYIVVL